jgi:hypothetical protein
MLINWELSQFRMKKNGILKDSMVPHLSTTPHPTTLHHTTTHPTPPQANLTYL